MIEPLKSTLAAAALFAAASAHADSKITATSEEVFDAANVSLIDAKTFRGNIAVIGERREDIAISIEQIVRNADAEEAEAIFAKIKKTIELQSDTLSLSFEYKPQDTWSFWDFFAPKPSVSINLEIRAPETIAQKLRTSGGNLKVEAVSAAIDAKTSGGHLAFSQITGRLQASTSGGHITASDIDGEVTLSTSGGHITLEGIYGPTEAKTSGGHITIKSIVGPVHARTSGGHINAVFPEGLSETADLRTSGGNVSAKLPAGHAFHLQASTSGGRVSTDFPVATQGKPANNKAEGDVNGGGPRLTLQTSGGNISIQAL